MKTIRLFPEVSMSDVMRKFRESVGTRIVKAYAPTVQKGDKPYWNIQFMGPRPNLTDLAHDGTV